MPVPAAIGSAAFDSKAALRHFCIEQLLTKRIISVLPAPCFVAYLMLLLETFLPSSTMQHSSMNDEKVSISCRYPSVASLTSSGIFSPSFCHIRQPSTAHDNMPGSSSLSFAGSCLSFLSSGMVTVKGISLMRLQML